MKVLLQGHTPGQVAPVQSLYAVNVTYWQGVSGSCVPPIDQLIHVKSTKGNPQYFKSIKKNMEVAGDSFYYIINM